MEVPLAVPLIMAGLRVATVSTIGLVTITAATLGDAFGGLGYFIFEGAAELPNRDLRRAPSRRSCWRWA